MKKMTIFVLFTMVLFAQQACAKPNPMKMDTNEDKKISREEATGKLAENFDKIDRNGDGYITMEELKALKKKQR